MAVHAGHPARLNLVAEGLSGERDDRHQPTRALGLTNEPGRRQTIHARHAHVHQHDIEIRSRRQGNGFCPAFRAGHRVAGRTKQGARDVAVHRHIIGEQDMQSGRPCSNLGSRQRRSRSQGGIERKLQPEQAAAAGTVVMAEAPAHQGREPGGQRQPNSAALDRAGGSRVKPNEFMEQAMTLIRWYAAPGVRDFHSHG